MRLPRTRELPSKWKKPAEESRILKIGKILALGEPKVKLALANIMKA